MTDHRARNTALTLHQSVTRQRKLLERLDTAALAHLVHVGTELAGSEAWPAHEPADPDREHSVEITPHDGAIRNARTGLVLEAWETDPELHDPTTDAAAGLRGPSAKVAVKAALTLRVLNAWISLGDRLVGLVESMLDGIPPRQLILCANPQCTTDRPAKLYGGRCRRCYDADRKVSR